MGKLINQIGKRFGMLTVIDGPIRVYSNKIGWKCVCDCGEETIVAANNLSSGKTISCGCMRGGKKSPGTAAFNNLYSSYKCKARSRGYRFELKPDEFKTITQKDCYYCGEQPKQVRTIKNGNGTFIYNGIDRKDNSIGYTIENVVPCCGICNRMKSDMNHEEFMSHIEKIYRR